MKHLFYLIPLLALATACGQQSGTEIVKMKAVDRTNFDTNVSPKNDFYHFANGGWMAQNPLPAEYSRYGTFDIMAENNNAQLKELIENLGKTNPEPGTVAQKVNDLFVQGMDSLRLNSEGASPLEADIKKIKSASREEFVDIISWLHMGLAAPFFDTGVSADLMDSNTNIMYLTVATPHLGDRDYYLEEDENTLNIRNAYVNYIDTVLTLAGYSQEEAATAAQTVLKIETAIAQASMTREERRDIPKLYNIRTIDQIKDSYTNIDWNRYLKGIGLPDVDKMCVEQPKAIDTVNTLLASLTDDEIRDYLTFCYVASAAGCLSDEFVKANFEMFSRTLSGKKEMRPRWKRSLAVPNGLLGEAVGELYVEKYFPAESKEKMLNLVSNLKEALGEHIANLEWMSDQTKANAQEKLANFHVKIGYPDKWKDYSSVSIDPQLPYWENVKAARRFHAEDSYSKWGKPVDKEEWGMTPQTVNAYYNPTTNEICFPAGILQAPYFDIENDDACNYGAIGVVIGHEMTHGFDDQGRNFDKDGNMIDWWTEEDAAKFQELTSKLVEQFGEVVVADDVHANGQFTLGENIADHGGLRVAYTAFKKTQQGQSDELIDGLTPDQRFYISYANVWKTNITK